ncbi:MAG: ABC transporter substrate-binding protein, partial [Myxococcales bacterium]|nr:ABC transporter substrate-binding protein [Myxococcales bacterium]
MAVIPQRSLATAPAIVLALAFVVVGCTRSPSAGGSAAEGGPASRVVSLAPSTTEALFAIGAGSLVVGRSRFCDYPPEARAIPAVGDVEPDLEALLGLRPDLVVGVLGLSSARVAEQLEARGIRAWFTDAGSFAAVGALIVGLGERV